jgi:hypothetical protein
VFLHTREAFSAQRFKRRIECGSRKATGYSRSGSRALEDAVTAAAGRVETLDHGHLVRSALSFNMLAIILSPAEGVEED